MARRYVRHGRLASATRMNRRRQFGRFDRFDLIREEETLRALRRPSRVDLAGCERASALAADELLDDLAAAAGVLGDPRRAAGGEVAVAPVHQREQRDGELAPALGKPVLEALGPLLVADALEDAGVEESGEPGAEDVACDPEARLELVEAAYAEEDVPDDQQAPALAHELERACDRA